MLVGYVCRLLDFDKIEHQSRNENVQLLLVVGSVLSFLSFVISTSMTWRAMIVNNNVTMLAENELPLCVGNLLDGREYHYAKEAKGSYNSKWLMSDGSACQLVQYTASHIAACFDAMKEVKSVQKLHFLFMGDSIIRQQYFNFVRLIPDFDKIPEPIIIPTIYHENVEITSQVFGLRLTYKWMPRIEDDVIETIGRWATNEMERPHLIFLSMSVHHMFRYAVYPHDNDLLAYEDDLVAFAPALAQLANVTQVIWLNQYPCLNFYGNSTAPNTSVHSEKIHLFNIAARRILGNYPSIRIFDSSNLWAVEYSRSCTVFQREGKFNSTSTNAYINGNNAYVDCKDFVHMGYAALSQATQLLFNDICNEHQVSYAK